MRTFLAAVVAALVLTTLAGESRAQYAYGSTIVVPNPYYLGPPAYGIYFDPFANTYRYTTGYRNTPTFLFSSRFPY